MAGDSRLLVEILDHAFTGRGWQGTTLTGAIRGVSPALASWRPASDRHSIWDLVLHTAYWKYAVRCRLTGERPKGGFARSPANWPTPPAQGGTGAWRADIRLLKVEHAKLRDVVAQLSDRRLARRTPSGAWRLDETIFGVAAHDAYHTGQIQLLKRLVAGR